MKALPIILIAILIAIILYMIMNCSLRCGTKSGFTGIMPNWESRKLWKKYAGKEYGLPPH